MARKTKSVMTVTKALNKKGRLKGKNKKETKMLKGICPHNKLNKRGHLKPTIFSTDGQYAICTMCGAKFPIPLYKVDEIDEIVGNMKELNNQNKYSAVSSNAGDQTSEYFANMGAMLQTYAKTSKKLRNVVAKQDSVKKKKNKNRGGSSMYGTWQSR